MKLARRLLHIKISRIVSWIALFALAYRVSASEPAWTKILTGSVTAGPVIIEDRVFVGTSDRSITCLASDGSFLWSRPLPGGPAVSLSTVVDGILVSAARNGSVSAYNPDGRFLWRLSGTAPPTIAPVAGRDGRFFLIYEKRITCVGPASGVKWSFPVDFTLSGPVTETSDGELIVSTKDGFMARISPYGELLERIALSETPSCLASASSGFFAGFSDGSVAYCHVRSGFPVKGKESSMLWRAPSGDPCRALIQLDGTLVIARKTGVLDALNSTDGSPLWSLRGPELTGLSIEVSSAYDQFTFASSGAAISVTPEGRALYSTTYTSASAGVALAKDGSLYLPGSEWAIRCFRPETRISEKKRDANPAKYGILEGRSIEYGSAFLSERDVIAAFFAEVSAELERGTVGPSEVAYARRLVDILLNDSGDPLVSRSFDAHERGRAASLLGALGSTEYREPLMSVSYGPLDESLAIGVLHGLSLLGPDPDGKTLGAIERILRNAGGSSQTVQRSACSALYSVARYSTGDVSRSAVSLLIACTAQPYSAQTNEFARAMLASLLE